MGAALLGNGYFAYLPIDEFDSSCSYVDPVLHAITAYPDEFEAGTQRQLHYLGRPLGEAQRLNAAEGVPNLLPNGDFEKDLSGTLLVTEGSPQATLTQVADNPGEGKSSLRIAISKLDIDPTDSQVRVRLSAFPVERGREYTLRLLVRADPGYGRVDPSFADIPRRVQIELRIAGVPSSAEANQDVLADAQWRTYWLSFVAGESDPKAALLVEVGREAGDVWLDGLRLSLGASDLFYRRFERGLILVNGSATPAVFDVAALMPGMALRRLRGLQDPSVNSGECLGDTVTVPARDALILQAQSAAATGTLLCLGGTLSWSNPTGTTQYQLQVTPANNDGPGINIIRNTETSFAVQPPVLGTGPYVMLPGMTYTWRVRASSSTTGLDESSPGWGPWSAPSTFRTPDRDSSGLRPVFPPDAGGVGASPQRLRWDNIDKDVFYYEVQVSTDPAFGERGAIAEVWHNLVHGGVDTTPNSWQTPALATGRTYYWRVRPRVQGDGTPVVWSQTWSFKAQ